MDQYQVNRRELLGSLAAAMTMPALGWAASAATPKTRHIVVTYAWSYSNIGDIGITPGLLTLLERYVPEARVTIVSNARDDARATENHRAFLGRYFPDAKVIGTPFRGGDGKAFDEAMATADLLLYNSGTTLSHGRWNSDWNKTLPYWMPLLVARDMGVPYGVYCQSFETFTGLSKRLIVPLLSQADFCFARDGDSLEFLRSLGVKNKHLEFGPDATFGYDSRDDRWAERFLREHKLEPRKFITLTIRSSIQGFIDEQREAVHAAKLRELTTTWVRKTGLPVLVCPEVKHELEPARKLIYEPLPDDVKKQVRLKETFWDPDQAFSVYAQARCIVSMEMHSVIMSIAAGTPTIHPRFAEAGRKAWMLRDLGVEKWLSDLDADPAAKPIAALLDIHDNFDRAIADVGNAKAIVARRQAETMAVVKAAVEEGARRRKSIRERTADGSPCRL